MQNISNLRSLVPAREGAEQRYSELEKPPYAVHNVLQQVEDITKDLLKLLAMQKPNIQGQEQM